MLDTGCWMLAGFGMVVYDDLGCLDVGLVWDVGVGLGVMVWVLIKYPVYVSGLAFILTTH
jgi:hypothetical protein